MKVVLSDPRAAGEKTTFRGGRSRRARSWRKVLVAGAIVTAGALALTGCVGQGSAAAGASAVNTQLPPANVSTTIKLWNYQTAPIPKFWTDGIAAFNKEYPNVKVETTNIPYGNMTSKLLGSGISKSIPDGMLYNPADSAKLYGAGIIQDMSPYWNAFKDRSQFPSSVVWKSGSNVLSVQGYLNTTAIWYNKTILDKAGITKPPKTMAEFGAALAAVKKAGYKGFLLSAEPNGSGEFDFLPWLYAYGQNYGHWDKKTVEKVFSTFGQWIDAGYIPKDIANTNEGDNGNLFANGQYAFVQNGNWNLAWNRAVKYPFTWGVANFPAGPSGAHGIGGGEGFSIGKGTKYPALVFKLFQTMLLGKNAEIATLKGTGMLPTRNDAASDPLIKSDPDLRTYATVVKELGARPNSPKISDYLNNLGKIWNGFVGGSVNASQAADEVVQQLSKP